MYRLTQRLTQGHAMKPVFRCAAAAALLVAAVAGADNSAPDNPTQGTMAFLSDKERLQGTWVITATEFDEEMVDCSGIKDTWTFTGDTISTDDPTDKTLFVLDSRRRPPMLTLVDDFGGKKVPVATLYEFKCDTLRICLTDRDPTAGPKEFTSKGQQLILTFKRQPMNLGK